MKPLHRLAILAALALIPVLPYVLFGYAGQDLPFHVQSWIELCDAHFVRGWSSGANFGLGDPHLLFYPPLSLYLGAFLTVILPMKLAPAAFVYIAVLLSGLTMFYSAKPFISDRDRLAAAVLYMLNPYLLLTALVRFAAAELLVQAVLPLVLLFFYRAVCNPDSRQRNKSSLILAALLAFTWLTDIPAAIVLFYGLFAVSAIVSWQRRTFAPILLFTIAEIASALLAAFYLAPIWAEQRWISRGALVAHDPGQLLLFMPQSSPADSVLVIACWIFTCVATLVIVMSLRKRIQSRYRNPISSLPTITAIVAIVFQLPIVYALWHHLPELATAQFPFRFLPLLFASLPLLLFAPAARKEVRPTAFALLAVSALLPLLGFAAMQTSASRQPPLVERVAGWQQQGYKGAPEYLPANATPPVSPSQTAAHAYSEVLSPALQCVRLPQNADSALVKWSSGSLTTSCATPRMATLPVFYYPDWKVTDEAGHLLPIGYDIASLLLIDTPAGNHQLALHFDSASKLRSSSIAISLISLVMLIAAVLLSARPKRPAKQNTV